MTGGFAAGKTTIRRSELSIGKLGAVRADLGLISGAPIPGYSARSPLTVCPDTGSPEPGDEVGEGNEADVDLLDESGGRSGHVMGDYVVFPFQVEAAEGDEAPGAEICGRPGAFDRRRF